MRCHFAIHQIDLVIGHAPGFAPDVIDRRRINQVAESQLDSVQQWFGGGTMRLGESAVKQMA